MRIHNSLCLTSKSSVIRLSVIFSNFRKHWLQRTLSPCKHTILTEVLFYRLGDAYYGQGDCEAALQHYDRAIGLLLKNDHPAMSVVPVDNTTNSGQIGTLDCATLESQQAGPKLDEEAVDIKTAGDLHGDVSLEYLKASK